MTRCLLAVLLGLVLAIPVPARADDCDNAQTQADMNECAGEALKASDAELNTVYKQIMQRLGNDTATARKLVAAQKSWLSFRDNECIFSSSGVEGGSVYPMILVGCHDRLTRQRIAELKVYLDCEEGDLSCPVPRP